MTKEMVEENYLKRINGEVISEKEINSEWWGMIIALDGLK